MTESVLKVRSFIRISWHRKIGKNVGWKMVQNFLGKDENTRRNLYLLSLKTSLWKKVRHFSVQCIQTKTTGLPTLVMGHAWVADELVNDTCTVQPAKSESDVMFCLQRYLGIRLDRSLVYCSSRVYYSTSQE